MTPRLASVILPVYNQAGHIGEILAEHASVLTKLPFPIEILPVVNGRRLDNSLEVCQSLEARHPVIRTLSIEEGGWGRAVRAGLAAARGDLLCYSNSARTTTSELTLMLLYASVHPDSVVKANRKIRDSWVRRLGSLLYNLECRALFDLAYWDINGTPKVFPRALSDLAELQREDDLIDLEFNVVCRKRQYPVIEVPIFSARRHSGRSTTGLRSAIRMYWGAIQMKRRWGR
jgi:glycosyltransferase involved in cell wall biosynthesis